jgi:hypothetical protein
MYGKVHIHQRKRVPSRFHITLQLLFPKVFSLFFSKYSYAAISFASSSSATQMSLVAGGIKQGYVHSLIRLLNQAR